MIGNVCAVKRDINRILETPQLVESSNFQIYVASSLNPALNTQVYALKQEGDNYYLYNLITKLDFYIKLPSDMEFWNEGMTVSILDTNDIKAGTGRLVHKGVDMDKALTKEEILASGCVIKPEYQTQFDNALDIQLIPEKYLLKPNDPPASVTFYYDSRYLSVTRLNLSIYGIEKVEGSYSNLSERLIDEQVSPFNQKSLSKSYIVCQIGDILLVEEKEHPDYEYGYLIIGGIWDYNSTSNVNLIKSNETSSLSFEITLDCFATFTIYSPKYKITASVPGGYIAPTEEGLVALLPDGYDFGFTLLANNESIPTYAKEGQEINLTMELANYPSDVSRDNLHYISPIVTVTYLENGVSTAKHLTPDKNFNATTTTSECSFTMPAADCHITVELKLYGDGLNQYVEPTEGESGYALAVTGNIKSVIIDGFYNTIPATVIALDKVNVSFTRKLGHSYTYSLYYTATGTTIKSGVVLGDCIEVDVWDNLTLNILELETDCVYTSATGKLSLAENWDDNNTIIGHNYYDNRSYAVDTENPLQTSGIHNNFRNKSITGITFNSTNDVFHIYNNAFKDCDILINTSINGPTSISVGQSAFENTTALQFADWMENITRLNEKSFKNSGILEYSSNPDITNIPKLAFLNCARLESVSLHNSNLTSIEECAFENCSNLSSISIPKCIRGINKYAFRYSGIPSITTSSSAQLLGGCTFITDSISPEISVIKEGLFQGCNNLKDIYLPDSIEHLETLSFAGCDNIQNFSSPGLKTIALGAFKDTWVEGIKIDSSFQKVMTSPGYSGALYKKSGTSGILFDYAGVGTGGLNKNYTIATYIKPDKNSDELILYKCNSVQKGLIPSGTMYPIRPETYSISPKAFYSIGTKSDSYAFESIGWYDNSILNKSLIGEKCFMGNQHLTQFTFPNTEVLLSGKSIFQNCTNLNLIFTRGCKVPVIPNNTFKDCVSLIPPDFTDLKVESIGEYAFDGSFRHAFDKYNNLCWIQNVVLLVAAVGYTFYTMGSVASTIENMSNSDLPQTHDKVKLSGSKLEHRGIEDFLDGPNQFNSIEEADSAAVNALDKMTDYATTHDGLDIFHPDADPDKFIPGEEYVTKLYRDYVGVDYDIQKSVDGHFYIVSPIKLVIRTFVSRTIKKKIWSYIKQKFAKVAKFFELAAPYIAGVSLTLGFGKFLNTIRDLVWQAYDCPMGDTILDLPSYSQAILSGVGLYPDRGVYNVVFPNTLAHIGKYAFRNCKDLKSVSFLQCPAIINEGTFYGCEFLSNVAIVKETVQDGQLGVEEDLSGYCIDIIRKYAFYNCGLFPSSINKLIEHVEIIEPYAFAKNKKIINYLQFDPTIEDLRKRSNNQMLVINSDTKQIGDYAFAGANFILFDSDAPELFNISSLAFNPVYDDGYNEYLGAMSRVFAVPLEYVNQYKQRFEELNLSYDYMVTYSSDDYRLLEFV